MLRTRKQRRKLFEEVALPHLDALYGMALRLTRDERAAEDLVQDALLKAFRFFHRFEEGSNIKAWLFKVLVNTFYNSVRKDKNIQRVHVEAEVDAHYERFLSAATINGQRAEEILHEGLVVEKLRAEVDKLPEEFRAAVLLCDLHDFSYKEIAEILGCPVGTVMSRLYRGRRLLQRSLYSYAVEQGYIRPGRGTDEFAPHRGASAGGEQREFAPHRGASAGGEQRELQASGPQVPRATTHVVRSAPGDPTAQPQLAPASLEEYRQRRGKP